MIESKEGFHGRLVCSGVQQRAQRALAAGVLLALLASLMPAAQAHGHECSHASVVDREQASIAKSILMNRAAAAKESTRSRSRTVASPPPPPAAPRIWLDFQLDGFSTCDGGSAAAVHEITSDTMPTAVKVLQKLFKVRRPTGGNLLLPAGWAHTKCIDALVDRQVVAGYGPGRPVDYVLHVTSAQCEGGTVAYAGVCAVGGDDNRPVMGAINLCPGSYNKLPPRRQIEVITHELLHAFVSLAGWVGSVLGQIDEATRLVLSGCSYSHHPLSQRSPDNLPHHTQRRASPPRSSPCFPTETPASTSPAPTAPSQWSAPQK